MSNYFTWICALCPENLEAIFYKTRKMAIKTTRLSLACQCLEMTGWWQRHEWEMELVSLTWTEIAMRSHYWSNPVNSSRKPIHETIFAVDRFNN